jgi:hypothetical protein
MLILGPGYRSFLLFESFSPDWSGSDGVVFPDRISSIPRVRTLQTLGYRTRTNV